MSPLHHVPSVEAIHQEEPAKHLKLEGARTIPDPLEYGINHNVRKARHVINP